MSEWLYPQPLGEEHATATGPLGYWFEAFSLLALGYKYLKRKSVRE